MCCVGKEVELLDVKPGGTLNILIQGIKPLLHVTLIHRRLAVNEELRDLTARVFQSPISLLLSLTDTEQTKPLNTAVTLNKTIRLPCITSHRFKNANYNSFPRPRPSHLRHTSSHFSASTNTINAPFLVVAL